MTDQTLSTIRVVHFPTDPAERVTVTAIENSERGVYRALGDAQPGHVFLPSLPRAALLCDEYGKSRGVPPNPRATRFVDRHVPGFARVDMIMGPCIVVGCGDEDWTDVPEDAERSALAEQTHRDQAPAWQQY